MAQAGRSSSAAISVRAFHPRLPECPRSTRMPIMRQIMARASPRGSAATMMASGTVGGWRAIAASKEGADPCHTTSTQGAGRSGHARVPAGTSRTVRASRRAYEKNTRANRPAPIQCSSGTCSRIQIAPASRKRVHQLRRTLCGGGPAARDSSASAASRSIACPARYNRVRCTGSISSRAAGWDWR